MSDSYGKSRSSYFYSSSTRSSDGEKTTGHRYTTSAETNPDGSSHVLTAQQDLGDHPVVEEHYYDPTGQEQLLSGSGTSAGGARRITELDGENDNTYGSGMAFREDVSDWFGSGL